MLKGASLLYVTVISLIIAIISSSLILFSYYKQQERDLYAHEQKVCQNVMSGIHLLLTNESAEQNTGKFIDLYGAGTDTVFLKNLNWGIFHIAGCIAFSHGKEVRKVALTGYGEGRKDTAALYLVDAGVPLSLCGETFLRGCCYLPQTGVKRGYIDGKNFNGNQLINGQIKQSSKSIPDISKALLSQLDLLAGNRTAKDDSVINVLKDTLINSFFNKTMEVHFHKGLVLNAGSKYVGNILIISDTLVEIKAGCAIQDIIICAPVVSIDDGFNGSVQVFASDSLHVGINCKLNYPSVLGLISGKVTVNKLVTLTVDKGSSVCGTLVAYSKMPSTQVQVCTLISKNDTINGAVFTNGAIDLEGVVYGNITCDKLTLKTQSSQYDNYLMDATIDITKRSKYFIGSIADSGAQKSIVKWLE
jgi:hypothetical protein